MLLSNWAPRNSHIGRTSASCQRLNAKAMVRAGLEAQITCGTTTSGHEAAGVISVGWPSLSLA